MKEGTIYNTTTGRIEMNVVAPDEDGVRLQIAGRQGLEVILDEILDASAVYIKDGVVTDRPSMPWVGEEVFLTPGEVFRVDGVIEGSRVGFPGGTMIVDDGFIEWATETPGSYPIFISKFPFKEVTFNAIVG